MAKPKDVNFCCNCGKKLGAKYFETIPDRDGEIGYVCSKKCQQKMNAKGIKRDPFNLF